MTMEVKEFLAPEDVLTVAAASKRDVLRTVAEHAAERLGLEISELREALQQREALGSTGIGGGVALPHARLASIARPHATVALLTKPIEFGAIDDRPVDLVVLLLLPAAVPDLQLRPLACITRRLRRSGLLDRLRHAPEPRAVFDLLVEE